MKGIAKYITLRLATPETAGSGFYLKKQNVIVTCEHIVRGYRELVVEGTEVSRQLAKVLYADALLDVAFLQTAEPLDLPQADISLDCKEEQAVCSYAHPFTEGEMYDIGYIDYEAYDFHGHPHIMHDALLSNAANGSALYTEDGAVLAMNNFLNWKGRAVGMGLPIGTIISAMNSFVASGYTEATKCSHCYQISDIGKMTKCTHCGNILDVPDVSTSYSPQGVVLTIEGILSSMGYTLELARIGKDHWEVVRGSATVNITYYEKNGLIIGDAYMCKLPDQSNTELYEYLLRQNYEMESLTFSVKGDDIILSLLIYDRYLNEQTGTELLTNLLEKADHFDNILVDQYQCQWASSRKLT